MGIQTPKPKSISQSRRSGCTSTESAFIASGNVQYAQKESFESELSTAAAPDRSFPPLELLPFLSPSLVFFYSCSSRTRLSCAQWCSFTTKLKDILLLGASTKRYIYILLSLSLSILYITHTYTEHRIVFAQQLRRWNRERSVPLATSRLGATQQGHCHIAACRKYMYIVYASTRAEGCLALSRAKVGLPRRAPWHTIRCQFFVFSLSLSLSLSTYALERELWTGSSNGYLRYSILIAPVYIWFAYKIILFVLAAVFFPLLYTDRIRACCL